MTVPETHNFVANGMIVHNSLEQDADVVMFIHRPDAMEKESPAPEYGRNYRGQAPQRANPCGHPDGVFK